jgi:hypothetical protein
MKTLSIIPSIFEPEKTNVDAFMYRKNQAITKKCSRIHVPGNPGNPGRAAAPAAAINSFKAFKDFKHFFNIKKHSKQ